MDIIALAALQNQQREMEVMENQNEMEQATLPKKILKKRLLLLLILLWGLCVFIQCVWIIIDKLDKETLNQILDSLLEQYKKNDTSTSL